MASSAECVLVSGELARRAAVGCQTLGFDSRPVKTQGGVNPSRRLSV
jgi:hypothetical protein